MATILYSSSRQDRSLFPQPLTLDEDQLNVAEGCCKNSKAQASKGPGASIIALLDRPCHQVRKPGARLLNGKRPHAEGGPVTASAKVPVQMSGDYSCMSDPPSDWMDEKPSSGAQLKLLIHRFTRHNEFLF